MFKPLLRALSRRRLWQRLFLAQALLVLSSIVLLVWVQQQRLEQGLVIYIERFEASRAESLVQLLIAEYTADGFQRLRMPRRFGRLIEAAKRDLPYEEVDQIPRNPPPGAGGLRPPPDRRAFDRPPFERSGLAFESRLSVRDVDGNWLCGTPAKMRAEHIFPILVAGKLVGQLHLARLPAINDESQLGFLKQQWRGSVAIAICILAAALLASIALSRRLSQPLRDLEKAALQIADGDFDVRVRISSDDEIGDLARTFNRTAKTLAENRQLRRQWSANMSHELRTPVTVLRAELHALIDAVRPLNPAALQSLLAEVERLAALIDSLYQLSLSEAGALDYQFTQVDLAALLDQAYTAQFSAFTEAGVRLIFPAQASGYRVHADARRLQQVLSNLLQNALRYTDAGGTAELSLLNTEQDCGFVLMDSAPAVPESLLANLCEPLFRADASRSRSFGGAGLGLAIVKAIVLAHSGKLTISLAPQGGLRVEVLLPRAKNSK